MFARTLDHHHHVARCVDEMIDYEIAEDDIRRLHLTPTGAFDLIQHLELPDTPVVL